MRRKIIVVAVLFVLIFGAGSYSLASSDYPNRDITFIVPYGSGGSTDPIARQFVAQLEKILKVNINVENKPGGAATIGSGIVVRAKPDGYTIGLGSNSSLTYQPLVNTSLPYRSPDDYQPIVHLGELPAVLAVRADAPWNTFEQFMDNARKNPGKVRVSNSGFGTTDDLVIRQLNKAANVKLVPVSFTGGGGEAMVALLGGRVEASSRRAITTLPFTKSGKVRVLGSFTKGKYYVYPSLRLVTSTMLHYLLCTAYSHRKVCPRRSMINWPALRCRR
jgi:tripartite-type tricarboxylate transporter receptor subunit TctC